MPDFEYALIQDAAAFKLAMHAAVASPLNPPAIVTDGFAIPATWDAGAGIVRHCVLRFNASAALNLTLGSVWIWFDGQWTKHSILPDMTFAAGDLSRMVVIEFPVGTRIACAFTLSVGTMTVHGFPIECVA